MKIKYTPGSGFQINLNSIAWGEERESVRKKLMNVQKADDRIIELPPELGSDLVQKRDIYENYGSHKNYFFLNYDERECLKEIEIHDGADIFIEDFKIEFEKEISEVITLFKKRNHAILEIENGHFFIPELKMSIATDNAMGGDSNRLSYFYAAKNTDHLKE